MKMHLHKFISYFEHVIHPAAGKNGLQKPKRRNSKSVYDFKASPDSSNIRASLRKQDNVRFNPAP